MKRILISLALLALSCLPTPAVAQSTGLVVQVCGTLPLAYRPGAQGVISLDVNGNQCIAGTFSQTGGTVSNATSGVATSATNQGSVSWNYGFNGTTWDQLQVDASKFLKVNCAAGCAGGTASNATSGQATSSTNGQTLAWLYGFNGTTWDQLQVDGSKNLKVTIPTTVAVTQSTSPWVVGVTQWGGSTLGAMANYGTSPGAVAVPGVNAFVTNTPAVSQSGTWTVQPGNTANTTPWLFQGNVSNASDAVATGSISAPTIAYNYGFNGTTWDRLQVDGSKNLKVTIPTTSTVSISGTPNVAISSGTITPLAGVSQAQTGAAASNLVIKASAGSLISLSGSAVSGSFIMLFNATSAPADGAVTPVKCWGPMAAAGPFVFAWGPGPVLTMSTGITVVSSSTGCFTKTATNAAFLAGEFQ